nr:DUF763 domain-containing protein [Pyrolobus fumarii]
MTGYWGVAELPLHDGHVPRWMAERMKRLLRAIVAFIVEDRGPGWLVERLADPLWFQALNNVIGMDWDSSGSTTVLTGLLRQVTETGEFGLMVAGGKGRRALETPSDLEVIGEKLGLSSSRVEYLKRVSRLAAAADSSLLQDGFQLYHHTVIVAEDGSWTIVQQGMSLEERVARRYHVSHRVVHEGVETLEPHTGVVSRLRRSAVLDLTSRASLEARRVIVDVAREKPERVLRLLREAIAVARGVVPLTSFSGGKRPSQTVIRYYRPLKPPDPRRIEPVLRRVYELQPDTIEALVSIRGVGPATIRALALIAELVYGSEASHEDPAVTDPLRYAFAVGGKDGYPYPFDAKTAEEAAAVLEEAVAKARIGDREKLEAIRKLRRLLRPPV